MTIMLREDEYLSKMPPATEFKCRSSDFRAHTFNSDHLLEMGKGEVKEILILNQASCPIQPQSNPNSISILNPIQA